MSEMEKLLEAVDNSEKAIEKGQHTREAILKRIIKLCPIRVGDVTEVTGYSHKGKQMEIVSLRWNTEDSWRYDGAGWVFRGLVLKKDGAVGLNAGDGFLKYAED